MNSLLGSSIVTSMDGSGRRLYSAAVAPPQPPPMTTTRRFASAAKLRIPPAPKSAAPRPEALRKFLRVKFCMTLYLICAATVWSDSWIPSRLGAVKIKRPRGWSPTALAYSAEVASATKAGRPWHLSTRFVGRNPPKRTLLRQGYGGYPPRIHPRGYIRGFLRRRGNSSRAGNGISFTVSKTKLQPEVP